MSTITENFESGQVKFWEKYQFDIFIIRAVFLGIGVEHIWKVQNYLAMVKHTSITFIDDLKYTLFFQ